MLNPVIDKQAAHREKNVSMLPNTGEHLMQRRCNKNKAQLLYDKKCDIWVNVDKERGGKRAEKEGERATEGRINEPVPCT